MCLCDLLQQCIPVLKQLLRLGLNNTILGLHLHVTNYRHARGWGVC